MARKSGRIRPVASIPRPTAWQARYNQAQASDRAAEVAAAAAEGRSPRSWFAIRVPEASAERARVDIAAEIGGWGVTAQDFISELRAIGARPIDLHVNSGGGEVFDGLAIMNAIIDHPAPVTAWVDGIAASAASFLVQGADEIVMQRGAMMMIHDAMGGCFDNEAGMIATARVLSAVSDSMAEVYAARAGGTADRWRATMRKEDTWYTASQAVEAGLADRIAGQGTADPTADATPTPGDTATARSALAERFADAIGHYERSLGIEPNEPVPASVRAAAGTGWLTWPDSAVGPSNDSFINW